MSWQWLHDRKLLLDRILFGDATQVGALSQLHLPQMLTWLGWFLSEQNRGSWCCQAWGRRGSHLEHCLCFGASHSSGSTAQLLPSVPLLSLVPSLRSLHRAVDLTSGALGVLIKPPPQQSSGAWRLTLSLPPTMFRCCFGNLPSFSPSGAAEPSSGTLHESQLEGTLAPIIWNSPTLGVPLFRCSPKRRAAPASWGQLLAGLGASSAELNLPHTVAGGLLQKPMP